MEFKKSYEEDLLYNGYANMQTSNKNELVMDIANNFGITFAEVTPQYILDVHKQLKVAETHEMYTMDLDAGYIHPPTNHMYDVSLNKQVDFIGVRVLLQTTTQQVVHWFTEDSGVVEHNEQEFIEVFEGVISHKEKLDTKLIKFLELISNTTDSDVLSGLDWFTFTPLRNDENIDTEELV